MRPAAVAKRANGNGVAPKPANGKLAAAKNGHANGKGNGFALDLSAGGDDAHDAEFEQY